MPISNFAETSIGGPSPSSKLSFAAASYFSWSTLFATSRIGLPLLRRKSAASRSRPRQAVLDVDDEEDEVRGDDRGVDLLLDVVREVVAVDDADAARVDELERPAFVLHDRRHAVARHARRRVDDRDPLAAERVEQRRLADVRPADDRDGGPLHSCPASRWTWGITRTSRCTRSAASCRRSARAARRRALHGAERRRGLEHERRVGPRLGDRARRLEDLLVRSLLDEHRLHVARDARADEPSIRRCSAARRRLARRGRRASSPC